MNLAGVASGRLDGFYEIDFGGCWDVAAGALLVKEAGGVVLDPFVTTESGSDDNMQRGTKGQYNLMCRRVVGAATAELAKECAQILRDCTKT